MEKKLSVQRACLLRDDIIVDAFGEHLFRVSSVSAARSRGYVIIHGHYLPATCIGQTGPGQMGGWGRDEVTVVRHA